ncbi:MAG: BACON domain-containing protein [Bacteroidales bacterium]|nr:BACON domain-containing protein [Bacteroidales bacterium]
MRAGIPILFSSLFLAVALSCAPEKQPSTEGNDNTGNEQQGTPSGPDHPGGDDVITLSDDKICCSAYGGSRTITVTTDSQKWTATPDAEWVSTSAEETQLTISVSENPGTSARNATVTVTAGSVSVRIAIEQEAQEVAAVPDETQMSYTLSEDAVIAPKSFAQYIVKAENLKEGGRYFFFTLDKSIPSGLVPEKGSKLVVNTPTEIIPDGLAGLVESVEETDDGGYFVACSCLAVTDIFKDLNLNIDELDLGGRIEKIVDAEGNEVPFTAEPQTKASAMNRVHIDLPQASWDFLPGLSLTPKMALDIALKLQMIIGDWKISTLNVKVDTDATLGAELELKLSSSVEEYIRLLTVYVAAIPVGPLLITPAIDVYAIFGVDGSIGLSAEMSTVLHSSASLHYDEINGLSGELKTRDPEPGETKFSAGPKVEAGFSYGLGVGPSVGIYGDALAVGMSVNLRLREAFTIKHDFMQDPRYDWHGSDLFGAEYATSYLIDAAFHARSFLIGEKSYTAPGVSIPGKSYKFLPAFNPEAVEITQEGDDIAFTAELTGPSLLGSNPDAGQLVIYLKDAFGNTLDFPFDLDKAIWESMWEKGAKARIKAVVKNDEFNSTFTLKSKPLAALAWKVGGTVIPYYNRAYGMHMPKPKHEDILRGILKDIRPSAAGEWKGCNWDDEVPLFLMEQVEPGSFLTEDRGGYAIHIPANWDMGSSLTVSDHSGGTEDFSWVLAFDYCEPRHFSAMEFSDKGFTGLKCATSESSWGGYYWISQITTDDFICHSPKSGGYPQAKQSLDMSGSGCYEVVIDIPSDYCTATDIKADNCPSLSRISLSGAQGTRTPFTVSFAGSGTKGLDPFEFGCSHASFDGLQTIVGQFQSLGRIGARNSDLGSDLSVGGRSQFTEINLEKTSLASISLSDLPSLTDVRIEDNPSLTSFSMSGCGNIKRLWIRDNTSLKCEVPTDFDAAEARGVSLIYDHLYQYDYLEDLYEGASLIARLGSGWTFACQRKVNGETRYYYYKSNGYGFYYPGEPQKGYHDRN